MTEPTEGSLSAISRRCERIPEPRSVRSPGIAETGDHSMQELIDTTDEEIDRFVEDGDPMTLRAALYQLTGDHRLTEAELGDRTVFVGPSRAIVDPEAVELVRSMAADFLRRHRD